MRSSISALTHVAAFAYDIPEDTVFGINGKVAKLICVVWDAEPTSAQAVFAQTKSTETAAADPRKAAADAAADPRKTVAVAAAAAPTNTSARARQNVNTIAFAETVTHRAAVARATAVARPAAAKRNSLVPLFNRPYGRLTFRHFFPLMRTRRKKLSLFAPGLFLSGVTPA
jgi:hypothetical protein